MDFSHQIRPLLMFPTRSPCEVYQHSAGSFGVFGDSAEDVLKGQFTQTWNIFSLLGDEGVNEAPSYYEHSSWRFDGTVHQLMKQERGSKNRLLRAGFIVQQKETESRSYINKQTTTECTVFINQQKKKIITGPLIPGPPPSYSFSVWVASCSSCFAFPATHWPVFNLHHVCCTCMNDACACSSPLPALSLPPLPSWPPNFEYDK